MLTFKHLYGSAVGRIVETFYTFSDSFQSIFQYRVCFYILGVFEVIYSNIIKHVRAVEYTPMILSLVPSGTHLKFKLCNGDQFLLNPIFCVERGSIPIIFFPADSMAEEKPSILKI